jgi:hypothetical protein
MKRVQDQSGGWTREVWADRQSFRKGRGPFLPRANINAFCVLFILLAVLGLELRASACWQVI